MKPMPILIVAVGLLCVLSGPGRAQPLAQYTFNDGTPADVSGNGVGCKNVFLINPSKSNS